MNKFMKNILLIIALLSSQHLVSMQVESQAPVAVDWEFCKEMLLNHSRPSLELARSVKEAWLEAEVHDEASYADHIRKCPFFMLDECSDESCSCRRSLGYREESETYMSKELIAVIDTYPEKTIHYAAFGSGFLFADFLIMVKTLVERPRAKILLSAIDYIYNQRLDCFNQCVQQFRDCIKGMFPEATLEVDLVDNFDTDPQLLAHELKPDIILAMDLHGKTDYFYDFVSNSLNIKAECGGFLYLPEVCDAEDRFRRFDLEGTHSNDFLALQPQEPQRL